MEVSGPFCGRHSETCSCFRNSEYVQSLQVKADMDGSKSLFLVTESYTIMWQTMIKSQGAGVEVCDRASEPVIGTLEDLPWKNTQDRKYCIEF